MVIDQTVKPDEKKPVPKDLELPLSEGEEKRRIKFLTKEILDRIGYGLSSQQFLNILFVQSGASLFLVGLINGLKVIVSVIVSYILNQVQLSVRINRILMSIVGLFFGVSIFTLTIAIHRKSTTLFIISFVIATIIAVLYGTLYQDWFRENLEMRKRGFFLSRISYYGLGITGFSMLVGAALADRFSDSNRLAFELFGQSLRLAGYAVVLIIAAVIFMVGAFLLLMINEKSSKKVQGKPIVMITAETWKEFTSNKVLFVLFISSAIISIVQTLATAYYGIFIYVRAKATSHYGTKDRNWS